MPKFMFAETIDTTNVITARLADGTYTASPANMYTDKEVGKFVKLAASSRFALCVAGDSIEGKITSMEVARRDDYTIGGVAVDAFFMQVTLDGLQATPGTGVIAIGDFVVTGTVVPKGTALSAPARVCKATNQITDKDGSKYGPFSWRVVAIGSTGAEGVSGAVGTVAVIRRSY